MSKKKVNETSGNRSEEKKQIRLADLTKEEDFILALMNIISIEEHLAFTAVKTGKPEYLTILEEVRKLRTRLMKKIVKNTEGELWCISKHLLAGTMRLMESSNKYISNDTKTAQELTSAAFDLYSLFRFLQKIGHDEK
ncbi:MAG: hypothetical protein AABX59_01525 [Nanoarchaeota archaeon]